MSGQKPINPEEARDWYLADREDELADATLKEHQYRLSPFLEWCELEGIGNLADLSGRHFSEYKIWRKSAKGNPNNVTMKSHLATLRVFIKWCGRRNIVPRRLYEYIDTPRMAPREDVRTVTLESDDAADILSHLRKFDYASRDHVIMELLWSAGMRAGSLRALDLHDYVPVPSAEDEAEGPYLDIQHRPESDTPLKNGELGERVVALKPELRELLDDYVATNRIDVEDEHGRSPLITTRYGRISGGTIRKTVYGMTRPCLFDGSCPIGEDATTCDYAIDRNVASKCPESISPHAVRKGAITWARLNDVPLDAISERMDVSPEILKRHYDRRTTRQQMESRRAYFDNL